MHAYTTPPTRKRLRSREVLWLIKTLYDVTSTRLRVTDLAKQWGVKASRNLAGAPAGPALPATAAAAAAGGAPATDDEPYEGAAGGLSEEEEEEPVAAVETRSALKRRADAADRAWEAELVRLCEARAGLLATGAPREWPTQLLRKVSVELESLAARGRLQPAQLERAEGALPYETVRRIAGCFESGSRGRTVRWSAGRFGAAAQDQEAVHPPPPPPPPPQPPRSQLERPVLVWSAPARAPPPLTGPRPSQAVLDASMQRRLTGEAWIPQMHAILEDAGVPPRVPLPTSPRPSQRLVEQRERRRSAAAAVVTEEAAAARQRSLLALTAAGQGLAAARSPMQS